MKKLLPFIIIISLGALIFGRSLDYDFVWDDEPTHLTGNTALKAGDWKTFWDWKSPYVGLYIPLSYTAWTGIYHLAPKDQNGKPKPRLFHLANLLLHLLVCVLVYVLLRQLTGSLIPSLAGALLFLAHPLQVESVVWISEFRGLLSALFFFGGLLAFVRFRQSDSVAFIWLVVACLGYLAALLSKPSAIVFPAFVLVIDVLFLKTEWKKTLLPAALFGFIGLPFIWLTMQAQPSAGGIAWDRTERLLLAGDALLFYLQKLLLPLNLAGSYGRTPHVVLAGFQIPALLILLVLLTTLGFCYFKRLAVPAGVILLFVAGFMPVSGLVDFHFQKFSNVADRYVYLSLFSVALGVASLPETFWKRKAVLGVAASGLLVFGLLSFNQTKVWKDDLTLWNHIETKYPDQPLVLVNRGILKHRQGDFIGATSDYDRALERDPKLAKGYLNRGITRSFQKNFHGAMQDLNKAIELEPGYGYAWYNRSVTWFVIGNYWEAKQDLEKAIKNGYQPPRQYLLDLEQKLTAQ